MPIKLNILQPVREKTNENIIYRDINLDVNNSCISY